MNMQDAPLDTPRLRILDHVRRKGAISRTDLSEQIGISPATVSVLCAELIGSGLCRDAAGTVMAPNRRGRPTAGAAVANIVNIFNPPLVIITGAGRSMPTRCSSCPWNARLSGSS